MDLHPKFGQRPPPGPVDLDWLTLWPAGLGRARGGGLLPGAHGCGARRDARGGGRAGRGGAVRCRGTAECGGDGSTRARRPGAVLGGGDFLRRDGPRP